MICKGGMAALLAGVVLTGGCASQPAVEVRSIGMPRKAAAGSDQVSLGRAALSLGNVGLALQEFRQSLRADPGSIDALSGIALCYDQMGRTDLSRRYYEEALALAPANTTLLRHYATALARQGDAAGAQAVISEIALRRKTATVQWVVESAPAAAPKEPSAAPIALPVKLAGGAVAPIPTVAPSAAEAPLAEWAPARASSPVPTPAPIRNAATARAVPSKVRLERVSLGEVALVTTGKPLWVALPAATAARSIRMLNAARRQGLAARTREQLRGVGWREIAIGDAPRTRRASLILYPAGQDRYARRLANTLRIEAIRPDRRSDFLVLLGRDSA